MPSNSEKKYLYVIASLIVGLFVMEYTKPKPIDWTQTFSKDDKIAFGSKALFELGATIFDSQELVTEQQTFYELEEQYELMDYNTIIMINKELSFGREDWDALGGWLENGGQLFVATEELRLPDTLKIEVDRFLAFWGIISGENGLDSSDYHRFANPILQKGEGYLFGKQMAENTFAEVEREGVRVLAVNGDGTPTFLEIEWGDGKLFWHCNPLVFTNYNLLAQNNHEYIANCLSYLPSDGKVLWDEYYKVGRTGAKTPLRVILSKPALSWAWNLSLFTIFIFIIFNLKRKQRVIPIITPPKNATLEFAATIGRLYLHHGDHQDLANKMVVFFKDHVRRKLYVKLEEFSSEEAKILSLKTGMDIDWIKKMLQKCHQAHHAKSLTEEQLLLLHRTLNQFYEQAGIKKIG